MDAIESLGLPESRWVDVGGPVHYRDWPGPPDGPTFVCVHGLGGSHLNWALVVPGLATRGRVVALDLAGFGLTPPADRATSVGANWRLLDGFIRALDLPPVVLVGNSMGGMITLIEAAHSPARVDSMILVDAAFPRGRSIRATPPPIISALFALYANPRMGTRFVEGRTRRLGPEGLVREALRLTTANPASVDPVLVQALVELARARMDLDYATRAFLEAARSIFAAQVRPRGYREVVRAANAPALVIHGGKDRLIPVGAAREAVEGHPDWDLVVFDDLGHIPMMEAPARWLEAVEGWLERRDQAGHGGRRSAGVTG